ALAGLKPIAEIQFSDFMYVGIHQLIYHMSKLRNKSRGRFIVPLVIRAPIGGGIRALEHHSESMESIYLQFPGLKVVMPSTPYDAKGLLLSAISSNDPVIFFEPKKLYRLFSQDIPEESYNVEMGKANVVKAGNDITIVTWGNMVRECLNVANSMKEHDIEVIDLRTLQPWDIITTINSVSKTKHCIVVQEAPRNCSLASEISATLTEKLMLQLEAPVLRVTGFDIPYPYFVNEKYYLPNADRISKAVKEVMEF
ncbi:MAG: transketolase C-terminal domain-containing protein, partial [Nanoarchaeota archaeon]